MRNATVWYLLLVCVFAFGAASPARAQTADLAVAKSGPATATSGSNVTYLIALQNNGTDDASAAQFDDAVPAGMTFVSATQTAGPAFTCSMPAVGGGGTVTCSIATLANGASAAFSIVLNIPAATPANTSFTNIATVSSMTFDPNDENNSSAAGTQVPGQVADAFITKTGPSSVSANTDVNYTITVGNNGPDAATNVAWSDVLPGDLAFVSFSQNSGPAFTCTTSSTSVTCNSATLAAGATATFTFTGHVPNGEPSGTTYTNTVSVTSDSDPSNENDSAVTTAVVSSADIAVTKSGPATAVAGGAPFDYTITLSNNGPDPASNARLDDPLPSGITFVALTQNSGPAAICATPSVGAGGDVACAINTLLNGQSAQFTLTVAVANGVSNGTVISNTVSANTDSVDSTASNNSSTVNTTVTSQADVAITKTAPSSAAAGSAIAYTLTVTNNGPSAASAVSLSDTLPAGETFVSITQTSGPTFACSGGATVTCTIATLASGASATFNLVANVNGSVPNGSTLSNTATVTSSTPDPTPGNNSSTGTTTVQATADLVLAKTGPTTVVPGTTATYTLTLTNNGPSSAAAATLTDTLPGGATFVSLVQNSGPAFICTTPAVGAGGTVACSNASLAANAVAGFSLVVAIPGNTAIGGTLINTASASSSTADPNGANSSASASASVVAAAALAATPMLDARMLLLLIVLLIGAAAWSATGRTR
jgi:uncharacterized repeat protein (TIGR01451 family)